jgi:5-methylcytosine-specific restriction protein A
MTKRTTITPKRRAEIFRDAGGICHLCSRKIAPGEIWEIEHRKPLALGGTNDADNLSPAHVDCHAGKTRGEIKIIRKADRQMKAHAGVRKKQPFPGGRGSRWKKTLDGRTVER